MAIDETNANAAVPAPNAAPSATKLKGDNVLFLGSPVRVDAGGDATITDADAIGYEVKRVATGLGGAVFVAPVPDSSGRVFVVTRGGTIRILDPVTGSLAATPFLDLSGQISVSGEQGLLGFATAPDFGQSGLFYVFVNNLAGDIEIRRYRTSAGNADVADPASAEIVFTIPHPTPTNTAAGIHNAGWIAFGPDGYLYIATGDSGSFNTSQSVNSLLGKVLRIDVSSDAFITDPLNNYAIPADNPFASGGGRSEIWALGFRNPYRGSIDALTGNILIGDVGESRVEEIDLIRPADRGGNYGWPRLEGTEFFGDNPPFGVAPVAEYFRADGRSVIGGYVYRGPIEALLGQYIFGDFGSRKLWSIPVDQLVQGTTLRSDQFIDRTAALLPDAGSINLLASFGVDQAGNHYAADLDGEIFRLQAAADRNLVGGRLVVDITENKVASEDRLQFDTSASTGVTLSNASNVGSIVSVGGVRVGTIGTGGSGIGADRLIVEFSGGATEARISQLIRAITYSNSNQTDRSSAPRTITYTIEDGGGTAAGGEDTLTVTSTVTVAPAADDLATTTEAAPVVIDVLANDGSGSAGQVVKVENVAIATGETVVLTSGATVTRTEDNKLRYDPNDRFDDLAGAGSGAANISRGDQFTYERGDGAGATVRVTVTGVSGPGDRLIGDAGTNSITGTAATDVFELIQGGDDKAYGLGGSDLFVFRAAMTSADEVDGGDDTDQISLQGDYATVPLTLGTKVVSVEFLLLNPGNDTRRGDPGTNFYSYNITTVTENVAPGVQMRIDAGRLRAGEDFTFNGSAETDGGTFRIYGGEGVDNLTGGSGSDVILFGNGAFGASDIVNGGAGAARDQLALRGNYTLTFGSAQIVSIESLLLQSGRDARDNTDYQYDITMVDANVVGGSITIDAGQLRAAETLKFNGSAEDDATFRIFGGDGSDTLTGGQLGDRIEGKAGADDLTGNGGNDSFIYREAAHSTAAAQDRILDFRLGDLVDLGGIDAQAGGGANDAFSFIGGNAFSKQAGQLRAEQTQTAGTWLVQGDIDGNGSADFQLLVTVADGHTLTQADFAL